MLSWLLSRNGARTLTYMPPSSGYMSTSGVSTFVSAGSAAEEVEMLTVETGCRTPCWTTEVALVAAGFGTGGDRTMLGSFLAEPGSFGVWVNSISFILRINILISFVAVPSRWFSAIEKIR